MPGLNNSAATLHVDAQFFFCLLLLFWDGSGGAIYTFPHALDQRKFMHIHVCELHTLIFFIHIVGLVIKPCYLKIKQFPGELRNSSNRIMTIVASLFRLKQLSK